MTDSKVSERPRVLLVARCFIIREDGKILFIKRSSADSHHPGSWEVAGGKLEEGQDLTHAVEEEVVQETGISVAIQSPVVYAESFIVALGKYAGLPYIGIFYIGSPVGEDEVRLSDEHEDFVWVSYEEALHLDLTPQTRKAMLSLKKHLV